jgi:hypothetical protein
VLFLSASPSQDRSWKSYHAIERPFPELENLVLLSQDDERLILPTLFGGAHDFVLSTRLGSSFPSLLQLLHSSRNLVDLHLHKVLDSQLSHQSPHQSLVWDDPASITFTPYPLHRPLPCPIRTALGNALYSLFLLTFFSRKYGVLGRPCDRNRCSSSRGYRSRILHCADIRTFSFSANLLIG